MTDPEKLDEADNQHRLRLDIHLNLEGLVDTDGPLVWLSQFAKVPDEMSPGERLIEFAGKLYHSRRLRARVLNTSLLGEPVWDMLLALYCFCGRGKALSVSGLCHSAGVPQTTALRWLQIMEQKKLVKRSRDFTDGRRILVSLTDETKQLLDNYLAMIQGQKPSPKG